MSSNTVSHLLRKINHYEESLREIRDMEYTREYYVSERMREIAKQSLYEFEELDFSKGAKFTLTNNQLRKILRQADSNDEQEDMISFEVKDGRLIVTQNDWGHEHVTTLMNKPC